MRTIPEEMAARIESGAAMLCNAWVLRRADGIELGFTDHDRDLIVEGTPCRAASGWIAGAADSAVGLSAGSAAVAGGLDDATITDADVEAGLYDGASVALWRVDWGRPDLRVRLWAATLARIRRDGAGFGAELEGPLRSWSGWSAGPMGGTATRFWGTAVAGSTSGRFRARSATSGGRPALVRLRTASTSRGFRTFRATTS